MLLFVQGRSAGAPGPAAWTADLASALADLTLYGAPAIAPALTLVRDHAGLLAQPEARPLLIQLLKAAMAPLEREGNWAPVAMLLRGLDDNSAPLLEDALLPEGNIDPTILPDTTLVVLAGLFDAAGRPGKALALLDTMEATRHTPRFMGLSWLARCHILDASAGIDALWPGVSLSGNSSHHGARALARQHAEGAHMEEALTGFAAALAQAISPAARRGIGADLAVLAAWLHGHGQGALLERHQTIAHHLTSHPALPREALDLLLRAPASRAWEPMRESWLETARRYFQRFVPTGHIPAAQPEDYLMRCRPAV